MGTDTLSILSKGRDSTIIALIHTINNFDNVSRRLNWKNPAEINIAKIVNENIKPPINIPREPTKDLLFDQGIG